MTNLKHVVAASVDVGFGYTKFTCDSPRKGEQLSCQLIPSVAPKAIVNHLGSEFLSKRNTVVVRVGETDYEVGPDAMLAMQSNGSRSLDLEFVRRDEYLALVRGALYFMNVEKVDFLCIGLPVTSFQTLKNEIEGKLKGEHEIAGRRVIVSNVIAVPQPIGGLFEMGVRTGTMHQLARETNLLIDPGFYTVDWVVTVGTKPVHERTNAADNSGMAAILRAIAQSISTQVARDTGRPADVNEQVLARLDHALLKNKDFKYGGQIIKLSDHMDAGKKVVSDALNKLTASIGSRFDIDNVLVVGGSQRMFIDKIREHFAGYDVKVAIEPEFANVRGFQFLATSKSESSSTKAA